MTPQRNLRCLVSLPEGKLRPVIVEEVNTGRNFCECTDTETGEKYSVHYSHLLPAKEIPQRFREHLFTQVAPILGAAVTAYPGAVQAFFPGITASTLQRRLREAIQAKQQYLWRHDAIDEVRWSACVADLTVSDTSPPLVGSRKAVRENQATAFTVPTTPVTQDIPVRFPDAACAEDFCRVLERGVFLKCPSFVVHGLPAAAVADLENRYKIVFAEIDGQPQTWRIMI